LLAFSFSLHYGLFYGDLNVANQFNFNTELPLKFMRKHKAFWNLLKLFLSGWIFTFSLHHHRRCRRRRR
jgi:hypothetical protein